MALGRRVCTQKECYLAVALDNGMIIADPAIDLEKSNIEKYRDSLFDIKHLTLYPGEQPTVFTIRPLTTQQKNAAESIIGERERQLFYVRCGLVGLRNYLIENQDGTQIDAGSPEFKELGKMGSIVTEDWMAKLNLPSLQLAAIYLMILWASEAQIPLSRPSRQPSGPPPSTTQTENAQ